MSNQVDIGDTIADLHYISLYADSLRTKLIRKEPITKADCIGMAQRMMELASKAAGALNVLAGPW